MRYLMMIALLLSTSAMAAEFMVTRNGKTSTYSDEEYVVVKRRKGPKPASKPAPQVSCPAPAVVEAAPVRKNTVKLYGGIGPSTYETAVVGPSLRISQDYEAVLGIGYSRQISERWSIEAIGLTNETGLLGVGYDF